MRLMEMPMSMRHWTSREVMMDLDLEPKPKPVITVGEDLSDVSVGELAERIEALRAEITRCEDAMKAKDAARLAADAVFGKPAG